MDAAALQLQHVVTEATSAAECLLAEADKTSNEPLRRFATMTLTNLQALAMRIANHTLHPSRGGGLGFVRGVGEWDFPHEAFSRLRTLAHEIDRIYQQQF